MALRTLNNLWEKQSSVAIQRIHSDFETAEMNAVSKVFGAEKSFGCLFHYIKAMLLHISKKFPLLHNAYHNKEDQVYKWIRTISALPLLRRADFEKAWPHLKKFDGLNKKFHKEASLFIQYMESEWTSKAENRWNFNGLVRTRTSNAAEAFYSSLKKDPLASIHGSLENFLMFMQQLNSEEDSRIYKITNNLSPFKPRNKLYSTVDDNILRCVGEYENWLANEKPDVDEFIDGTKHYLGRLSHLLLEMSEWGVTRKEEKGVKYEF